MVAEETEVAEDHSISYHLQDEAHGYQVRQRAVNKIPKDFHLYHLILVSLGNGPDLCGVGHMI